MKKSMLLLATIAALAPCLPLTTNAATGPCATTPTTQVYDLKADWSDTHNPNGTWSYRLYDGSLLPNDFIWHQPLARNGASEDTDPSAGRTVKYSNFPKSVSSALSVVLIFLSKLK